MKNREKNAKIKNENMGFPCVYTYKERNTKVHIENNNNHGDTIHLHKKGGDIREQHKRTNRGEDAYSTLQTLTGYIILYTLGGIYNIVVYVNCTMSVCNNAM